MKEIIDRIREGTNFIVTSHVNPDGDNVGSSVAMTKFLKAIGKNAIHVLDDTIPQNLQFLFEDGHRLHHSEDALQYFADESYDVIALDSADKKRIALQPQLLQNASAVINIDHHMSNSGFGDWNYIVSGIGSTCEVLTNLLRAMDESKIDPSIATALYTGISTDTGNFLFSSVNKDTFCTAAFLTEKEADRNRIANEIYRSTSLGMRKLTGLVLENFIIEENVGIMVMTNKMLEETAVDYNDTDSIANIPVDTQGVEVGILIKEREAGQYKISLRSKEYTNVCKIAEKFGGGGHFHAAGCTVEGSLEEVTEKLRSTALAQVKKDREHAGGIH